MTRALRVVHYLNQFFAGIGGETQAGHGVGSQPGPVGPGLLLQRCLGGEGEVVLTVYCGDNRFAERTEETGASLLQLIAAARPDVVVLGPAFNAGRYGTACAVLSRRIQTELEVPVVTGMFPENPGFDMSRAVVAVVPCPEHASAMAAVMPTLARIALKLGRREPLGSPDEDGYAARGQRRNVFLGRTGAERAIEMLVAKVSGRAYTSEIPVPDFGWITAAPPVADLSRITFALATTGGVVPLGNPDGIESRRATHWGRYSIAGLSTLDPSKWTCIHGGFDNQYIHETPDRQVPLDILRELEREGVIGGVHEFFYSTVGAGAPVHRARAFGQEIADELKKAGVGAVIFTST